ARGAPQRAVLPAPERAGARAAQDRHDGAQNKVRSAGADAVGGLNADGHAPVRIAHLQASAAESAPIHDTVQLNEPMSPYHCANTEMMVPMHVSIATRTQ